MGKLKVWSKQLNDKIELKKESVFKRDYKFFKIDRLERINERIDVFSEECQVCESFKTELEDIVEKLPEYINGSPRDRAEYEKRNDKIVKHLKVKHGLVAKQYYASLYALYGLLIGSVSIGIIAYIIHPGFLKWAVMAGFTAGIIIGRVVGNKKDKQILAKDLIL